MPLEQSPDLNDFEMIPEPVQPSLQGRARGKPIIRILIIGLAALVALLTLANIAQGDLKTLLAGSGNLQGIVVDENGKAPQGGYAKILGTEMTATLAPDGSFRIEKVPAGAQSLVILDQYTGREIAVLIENGETLDVGTIQFRTTAVPEP